MALSEPQRIRGEGVEVELAGTGFWLRFDFDALMELEEQFGSLPAFAKALDKGFEGPALRVVKVGLAAGLKGSGFPIRLLDETIELADVPKFHTAIREAFMQAMPPAKDGERGEANGETAGSPGETTTTSRPSASDAATPSSGG